MKKLFTLFLVFISFSSFAQKTKVDSLITKLSKKIAASQYFYHPQLYIEIAFIRDEYNVPNLLKDDSVLIKRLNDFYYSNTIRMENCLIEIFKLRKIVLLAMKMQKH